MAGGRPVLAVGRRPRADVGWRHDRVSADVARRRCDLPVRAGGCPAGGAVHGALSFAKTSAGGKSLICRRWSGENPGSMITLLLHVLRLLPSLFGAQRQLAVENLALRQQLAVYKRTTARPKLRTTDRLFWIWLARVWAGVEAASRDRYRRHRPAVAAAPLPRVLEQALLPLY